MVTANTKLQELVLHLGSCPKCKGDLAKDDDAWRCLQCARYYFPRAAQVAVNGQAVGSENYNFTVVTQKKPAAIGAGFDVAFDQILNTW